MKVDFTKIIYNGLIPTKFLENNSEDSQWLQGLEEERINRDIQIFKAKKRNTILYYNDGFMTLCICSKLTEAIQHCLSGKEQYLTRVKPCIRSTAIVEGQTAKVVKMGSVY